MSALLPSFYSCSQYLAYTSTHRRAVHLPTDRRVLQPRRCAAALSLFCSAAAQTRHSVGVAVSALLCADCNELFHVPVPGLDLGPRTRQSNTAQSRVHVPQCHGRLAASGLQEELKVTDNRDATKSSYKQEMQKRLAKQVDLRLSIRCVSLSALATSTRFKLGPSTQIAKLGSKR